nr:tetratricopeptide repeat protein [Neobacillus sp. Marseille-Q6967]
MSIISQLKTLYEQKQFHQALNILSTEINRMKKLRYSDFKNELNKINSSEEFQVLIRLTDHFLMYHFSSFIARFAYRRFPDLLTTSWYCEELLDHGRLLEADDLITKVLDEVNKDINESEEVERLYFCKIRCLLEMKRMKEAVKVLETLKKSPRPIADKVGYVFMQLGDRVQAEQYFRQGLEIPEKARHCYVLLSGLKAANGQIANSLALIEEAEKLFPETPAFMVEKIKRFRDLGNWTEVLKQIEQLNEWIPDYAYKGYFTHLTEIAHYQLNDLTQLEHNSKKSIFKDKNNEGEIRKLNIKPILQKNNYCVPASLEMILTYYGKNITQDEIAGHIFEHTGSKLSTTIEYLEKSGFVCRQFIGNKEIYTTLLDKGIPVLLSVDFEHSSHVHVLTGYDSRFDLYHIQDPNSLETMYLSSDELEKANAATSYMSIVFTPKERAAEISFLEEKEDQYFRSLHEFGEKMEEDESTHKEHFYQFLRKHIEVPYTPIYVVKHFSFEEYKDFILQCAERLKEKYPDYDFMNLHVSQAFLRLHLMENANQQLAHVKQTSFSPLFHFLKGRIALFFDQYDKAIDSFRKSLQLDPEQYYTWSYLALSYLFAKDVNKADYYSSISLELASHDRFIRMNHAAVLVEKKMFDEARRMYDQLIREEPGDGHTWYERARLDQKLGRFRRALRGFKQSIKLENHLPYAYLAAADVLEYEIGKSQEAEGILLSGLNYAKSSQIYIRLGEYYLERKRYRDSECYFRKCIDLFPNDPFAYVGLTEIFAREENKEKALYFIQEHEGRFEDNSEFLINTGRILSERSKETDSVPFLEKALQLVEKGIHHIQSNLDEALELYVKITEENGFEDRAIGFLQQKFNENPESLEFKCYEGTLHEEKHHFSLAIDCYQTALKVKEDAFPYYRLGEVYFNIEQYKRAAIAFKNCLQLNRNIDQAYLRLAEISALIGDYEEEIHHLMELFDIDPLSVNPEYLSSLLDNKGNQQLLVKIQSLGASIPEIWKLDAQAYVYGSLGNIPLEEEYVLAALSIKPEMTELLHHHAKVLIKKKQWGKVTAVLTDLLNKHPGDEELYHTLILYTAASNQWSKLTTFLYHLKGTKQDRSTRFLLAAEAGQQYISEKNWNEEEGNIFGRFVRRLKNRTKQISIFGTVIELYETALKLDKRNLSAISRLAKFYENFELVDDSRRILQKALKENWDDRIVYQLGMILLEIEEYQEALRLFERQLHHDPEDTHLQYLIAIVFYEMGELEEAERRLIRIIQDNPFEPNVHFKLGSIWNQQKRLAEAKEVLEQGLAYHPFDCNIKIQVSSTYRHLKENNRALFLIEEVLEQEQLNLEAHFQKACILALLNFTKKAQQELDFVFENDDSGYYLEKAGNSEELINLIVVQD